MVRLCGTRMCSDRPVSRIHALPSGRSAAQFPKGGPGDHTFFQVDSEKQFVREDLRLAVHRQTELGEVIWPRPKAADPVSWGRSWPTGSSEMGSERQQGTTSAGPGFFEAVTGASPRAPDTADQSDLINVLLEQLLQAKDALRNAEQHKEDKEAKETQSKLEQERTRSESVEAKTEIKRERSRSCRPQRSDPVISVSPVRAPLKGKAPPAQPHRRLGAGS